MLTETFVIVRPTTTGEQDLASRVIKGMRDTSHRVAVYSPPELCDVASEDLKSRALVVVSPGQCIETSGDESVFLSKVTSAQKRILASVGPVDSPWYRGRLRKGITFDAVFDLGFASQRDRLPDIAGVPYHFVFNGHTREEEPLAREPAHPEERTIPWVLVGPKSDRNRDLLGELFEDGVDPGGFCLLKAGVISKASAHPLLGSHGLSAVLCKAGYYLWGADHSAPYYESFRFIDALSAGAVPCKIDPDLAAEEPGIPGVYHTVPDFQAEVRDKGYFAMYRRATEFYVAGGRLADGLSRALRLV